MSLYEDEFDFAFVKEKLVPTLPLIIFALIIAFVAYFVITSIITVVQPKAIGLSFSNNPFDVSKTSAPNTILTVVISNITDEDAKNVLVEVKAVDFKSITIDKEAFKTEEIELLGKGESRSLKFIVSPVDKNKILQGKYTINVQALINEDIFKESITLQIEK